MAGSAELSIVCKDDQKPRTEGEVVRRTRGRPTDSKNKPKPPIILTRDSANALRAQAIEVSPGCDLTESLTMFAKKKQRGISVLSATGFVTDVTLRQPGSSGAILTLQGRFEILSLLGSILPSPASPGITIYLAGAQGQVVGGGIVGSLIASGPVLIMAATFMNASFDRLPLEELEPSETTTSITRKAVRPTEQQHHHIHISEVYGVSQNVISNDNSLPPDIYTWAPGRQTISKT